MKKICSILIFAMSIANVMAANSSNISFNLYGNWRVAKYVSCNISGLSDRKARLFIGRIIVFQKNYCKILTAECSDPIYEQNNQDTFRYFYKSINPTKLNIKSQTVNIISISCKCTPKFIKVESPDFDTEIVIVDNNTLAFEYEGVYFVLNKAK